MSHVAEYLAIIGASQLSAPITKLIEVVAAGCGVLYEPRRIRAKAQAEADALLTQVSTAGLAAEMEERAAMRVRAIQRREQANIEAVAKGTAEQLPATVSEKPVDPDWAFEFFQHAKNVGNPEMQRVWSKILAGEITNPGSFSLRSLHTVRHLSRNEAELFTRACSYVWTINDEVFVVVGLTPDAPINLYEPTPTLGFDERILLESAGLAKFGGPTGYSATTTKNPPEFDVSYFGFPFRVRPTNAGQFPLGNLLLTETGKQLVSIAGGTANVDYRDATIRAWARYGCEVSES